MALTKKDLKQIGTVMDEKLNIKLKPLQTSLTNIDKKVDILDTRISSVEKKVDTLDVRVISLEKNVSKVEQKVDELTEFVVPAIGNILAWTDDIHRAIIGKPTKSSHGN